MTRATPARLPLEGIRVLELGAAIVLPAAIAPLAGMGADVIKVESGSRPEQTRSGPQPENRERPRAYNSSGHFQTMNRNKRGITLDLATMRGREVFLRLVAVSDVVAENFTARVLANLRLDYDMLRGVNPRIILLSSNGFGHQGPWQNYKAYGPNIESVDGLMSLTGYLDGVPKRGGSGGLGVTYPDVAGAYFGTFAILAALEQRERTGVGQWLGLSHYEAGVATLPEAILEYTMKGRLLQPRANRDALRAPQGVYPCDGLDRWIAVSIETDEEFGVLCRYLDRPGLAEDPRFSGPAARRAHHDELDELLAEATRSRDARELERELQTRGIEATAVQTVRDIMLDPQLKHRGFFEMVPPPAAAPEIGYRPYHRPGWRMANAPATTRRRAPEFGEHTDEVLTDVLGMPAAEIAALEAEGVIAREPRAVVSRELVDLEGGLASGRFREIDPRYQETMWRQFMGDMDMGPDVSGAGSDG